MALKGIPFQIRSSCYPKKVLAFPTGDCRAYLEKNLAFIEISVVLHVVYYIARFFDKIMSGLS